MESYTLPRHGTWTSGITSATRSKRAKNRGDKVICILHLMQRMLQIFFVFFLSSFAFTQQFHKCTFWLIAETLLWTFILHMWTCNSISTIPPFSSAGEYVKIKKMLLNISYLWICPNEMWHFYFNLIYLYYYLHWLLQYFKQCFLSVEYS